MIGIKFKISNEYDQHLDKIFENVDSPNFIWKIVEEEAYKQDGSDLFNKNVYLNKDFKNLISNTIYYTIFLHIQLYIDKNENISLKDYSDFTNSNCELVIFITDNQYIDIYSKNKAILHEINKNAISYDFSNIEIITKQSQIRKFFSAYKD